MAHDHDTGHSHETDAKAAFMGLFIGLIVLFGIVRGIVSLTNAKYSHEKPGAEATK